MTTQPSLRRRYETGHNPRTGRALPKASLPKISLPKISLPKISLPKISLPKIS